MGTEQRRTGDPTPADVFGLVGQTFAERFLIERVVGEGGFAVVYAARHLALDTRVAVKVMKAHEVSPTQRAAFDAMFLGEARTIAKLRHPAIVQVTDCGVATLAGGTAAPWMSLEWLDGETLDAHLEARRGRGGTAPATLLPLLRNALEGVAYAHQSGVAHRDLKPANLMLVSTPQGPSVRVMDFGVAKAMNGEDEQGPASGFTRTRGTASGFSPTHAAPEQVTGMRTGPWTDVHALGLIVVEMLLDRPAYDAANHQQLYGQILSNERPTPARFGVDVGSWESVLRKALAWSPEERFGNARALIDALEAELPGARHSGSAVNVPNASSVSAPSLPHGPSVSHTTLQGSSVTRGGPPARAASSRRGFVIGGVVIAGLIAGGVATTEWLRSRVGTTPQHASAPGPSAMATSAIASRVPTAVSAVRSITTARAVTAIPPSPTTAPAPSAEPTSIAANEAPTSARVTPAPLASSGVRNERPATVAAAPTGTLRVLVLPWGEVFVDGRSRGRAPVTLTLPAGRHAVRVAGGVQEARQVELRAGAVQTVAIGNAGLD